MSSTELNNRFKKAFEIASNMTQQLPPDVMLRFYAYYKISITDGSMQMPSGENNLRNSFKTNALFQFSNLSIKEAKERYIALVEKYTNQKII